MGITTGPTPLCKGEPLTWAAQMLYWVNMASYKAISPLCPAAAQARASKTGIACNTQIDMMWLGVRKRGLQTRYRGWGSSTHHLFQLVLTRVQGLPDALRQKDLMAQALLAKGYSSTGHQHHLSALIL